MPIKKYQKTESVQHDETDENNENEEIEELKPKKKKVIMVDDDDETPNVISYSKAKTLKPRKPMSEAQKAHVAELVENNKMKFAEYRKLKQEQTTKKHADEVEMMVTQRLKKVIVADRVKKPNKNHPFKQLERSKKEIISDSSDSEIIDSAEYNEYSEDEEEIIKPKKKPVKYEPIQKQRQPKQIIEDVNKTIERIKEIDKYPVNPYIALIKRHR